MKKTINTNKIKSINSSNTNTITYKELLNIIYKPNSIIDNKPLNYVIDRLKDNNISYELKEYTYKNDLIINNVVLDNERVFETITFSYHLDDTLFFEY